MIGICLSCLTLICISNISKFILVSKILQGQAEQIDKN